jgi:hypothetical protein
MTVRTRGVLAATLCSALLAPAAAQAAPVTVNLRIEGASQTVFEGPVTTDARQIPDASDGTLHACDVRSNGGNAGAGAPQGTATTAAFDAATANGFAFRAEFTGTSVFNGATTEVNDFFVNQLGPDAAQSVAPFAYHQLYVNGTAAQTGGCQVAAQPGQEVVWGYSADANRVLRLTGPARVRPGEAFTVGVTNAATGAAVEGATVAGGTTDSAGAARVVVRDRGAATLKAEASRAIRSNALTVCATDGADGFCGTTTPTGQTVEPAPPPSAGPLVTADRVAPFSRITGIRDGQVFRRRARAPRVLRGTVADAGAIRTVKLRLTRRAGGACSSYSGRRERFIGRPCGAANGFFFAIGADPTFEYQLAERLRRGRYVLDVNAVDAAFNRDDTRRRGTNRVVFHVR